MRDKGRRARTFGQDSVFESHNWATSMCALYELFTYTMMDTSTPEPGGERIWREKALTKGFNKS